MMLIKPRFRRTRTVIAVAALAAGLLTSASAHAKEEVPELVAEFDAIENPAITAEMEPPESLSVGRAEIRPGSGSRLYLLSVDGRDVGYLLDGRAELVYRVEDEFSVPAAQHNLERADGIDTRVADGVLNVSTKITGAAVWGWDLDLGEADGSPVEGRDLPGWLTSLLDQKFSTNPARDLLCADRNGDAGFRWAIFQGAGEDLILDVDPRPSVRMERLYRLLKSRSDLGPHSGRRYTESLASQPIGRPWWEPETNEFATVDTEIHVRNEEGNHVQVTSQTQIQPLREGLRILPMRHLSGVLDDGQWHEFQIHKLLVDGEPAPHVHRDGALLVALPRSSTPGSPYLLEVEAAGEIIQRPSGDNYWRLGGSAWYPKPGSGGEEWAEIRITAETRDPFKPFAGGEVLERGSSDGMHRVRTRLQAPMEFAMVVAGKYQTITEENDRARVHVSSYGSAKEEAIRRIGQVILAVEECLESWLGVPYPFPDLQVIEVKQWGWGQAPPGLIFITQEAFLTRASAKIDAETTIGAAVTSRGINERVAHEVAHAWFPHVAKVVRGEENWLSESLADYASAVCLEQKMANKKKGRQYFERQLREWKNGSKEAGDATSIYLTNHLAGNSDNWRIWRGLLYGRGPLVLHAIRQELQSKHGEKKGDQLFFGWIRSYVKNFTYKVAETRHLIAILNQITGEDWQPFFERHVYGVEAPEVD